MNDDPIMQLERELVRAAERQQASSRSSRRPRPGTLALLGSILVTIVVAGGVLLLVPRHHAGHSTATTARTPTNQTNQQLTQTLGVLRRPQTALDRKILHQSGLSARGGLLVRGGGTIDAASARLAAITPWGSRVLLVLTNPPTAKDSAALRRRFPNMPMSMRDRSGLILWVDHGGGCCSTAGSIAQAGDLSFSGAGRAFAGGSTAERVYVVVPDGVAKVAFYSPPQSVQAGGPTYRHGLTLTVPVHGNVAAVQWDRECCNPPLMTWYGANGQVIKRIGNFAAVGHQAQPPQPAPPTALSRAAQRNPATPNPVTVTPATGGPNTTFRARFAILINDADYQYSITGPAGCRTAPSGGIAGGGGPYDIRGRVFTIPLAPTPPGTWCPGTYKLSVALYDLGRAGGLGRHRPTPFGTTTFTDRH